MHLRYHRLRCLQCAAHQVRLIRGGGEGGAGILPLVVLLIRGVERGGGWDPPISLQCAAHQVLLMRGAEGCVCWDPPFGLKSKCCPPGTAEMRRGESGGRGGGRDGLSAVCVWPAVQRMHGAACMGTHCASPGASCLVMPVASAPTLAANDPTSPIMYACPPCLMHMCQ